MMLEDALLSFIGELEQRDALNKPGCLRRRLEALDKLDAYIAEWRSISFGDESIGAALHQQARTIAARLESANLRVYEGIRRDIRRGAGRESLFQWAPDWNTAASPEQGNGYDYLDELISGVLFFGEPSPEVVPLEAEMVPYQPTPARHIFDLLDRTRPNERDLLIDLGSGLGHVPLMASICTGAQCIGIEVEAAFVDYARRSAQALGLNNATFIEADARSTDLSGGTVFYLYTPFTGTILRDVLNALRHEAASREIRICTFGPCTRAVSEEKWLSVIGAFDPDRIVLFHSRS